MSDDEFDQDETTFATFEVLGDQDATTAAQAAAEAEFGDRLVEPFSQAEIHSR